MKSAYYKLNIKESTIMLYKSFDYTILKYTHIKRAGGKHMEMDKGFDRVIGSQVVFLFLYFS